MKSAGGGGQLSGRGHGSKFKEQIARAEKATAMPAHYTRLPGNVDALKPLLREQKV